MRARIPALRPGLLTIASSRLSPAHPSTVRDDADHGHRPLSAEPGRVDGIGGQHDGPGGRAEVADRI